MKMQSICKQSLTLATEFRSHLSDGYEQTMQPSSKVACSPFSVFQQYEVTFSSARFSLANEILDVSLTSQKVKNRITSGQLILFFFF